METKESKEPKGNKDSKKPDKEKLRENAPERSPAVVVFRGEEGEKYEGVLQALDQQQMLDENEYRDMLKEAHTSLLHLQRGLAEASRPLIVVVEGPDAAGKGGAIKRLVERLDPRSIRVYSIVKPTAEEYAMHYLWRFWIKLPPRGHIAIFDRSWYGRVLVERVEGFAKQEEWKRAYREICEFERTLTDDGAIVVKIFLQITKEEQLVRFKKREADPLKHWKISAEDWRNRSKWDQHVRAAEDMLRLTSARSAPWHVIAANSKWFTRLQVLKIVQKSIERAGVKL